MCFRYYGGWAAPNIYFLGFAGVIKFGNIRIGGLSGIYNFRNYKLGGKVGKLKNWIVLVECATQLSKKRVQCVPWHKRKCLFILWWGTIHKVHRRRMKCYRGSSGPRHYILIFDLSIILLHFNFQPSPTNSFSFSLTFKLSFILIHISFPFHTLHFFNSLLLFLNLLKFYPYNKYYQT